MLAGRAASAESRCDLLVAGGGPAGLAAAIALAERQFEVLLADPSLEPAALSRCEMLPDAAGSILARLGIAVVLEAAVPLEGVVSLWGGDRAVDHGAAPGLGRHGWSVERGAVETALCRRARALGADLRRLRVKGVSGTPGDWRVSLQGHAGETAVCCRYLIDATGRRALLSRRLGARIAFGSNLVAVTCEVLTSATMPPRLLAEATPGGWWYALPRNGCGGTLGFFTGGAFVREAARSPGEFLKERAAALRLIALPTGASAHRPTLSDSRSARVSPVAGPGWLAAGDAAAAFDPIASQGLFNALSGGFFAGNAAADALTGDHEAQQVYADLVARTAARTHLATPLQYAARPYATPFWMTRAANRFAMTGADHEVSAAGQPG